jgi:hypothetical protein
MDIKDITFKDSCVIFHDATWDYNRIPALAIVVENPGGSISNVTFENIEIHHASSRAIGCLVYESGVQNFNINNVTYKNISYTSSLPNKIAGANSTNRINANFENIYYNGSKVTAINSSLFETDSYATITLK